MTKKKKILIISGITLDLALTIFFFVVSIIMIIQAVKVSQGVPGGYYPDNTLIGYLQRNTTVFLVCFVVPLFVLLAANIVLLVIYIKYSSKKEPVKVKDLNDEQLAALKEELLKDIANKDSK